MNTKIKKELAIELAENQLKRSLEEIKSLEFLLCLRPCEEHYDSETRKEFKEKRKKCEQELLKEKRMVVKCEALLKKCRDQEQKVVVGNPLEIIVDGMLLKLMENPHLVKHVKDEYYDTSLINVALDKHYPSIMELINKEVVVEYMKTKVKIVITRVEPYPHHAFGSNISIHGYITEED